MEGQNLATIAKQNNTQTEQFSNVNLSAPTIPSVGIEPGIVSAALVAKQGKVVKNLVGKKGVFAIVNKSISTPTEEESIKNATTSLKTETSQLQNTVSSALFNALKEEVEIEDYRASRY